MFAKLPSFATYLHSGAREGFEVVFFRAPQGTDRGLVLEGATTALESGDPWSVQYRIEVDHTWHTIRVESLSISSSGRRTLHAERHNGRWVVDGTERPDLDGCVDVDFESSLVTNTLAVHRIDLASTTPVEVPAAFVRADDLRIERLEQTYRCTERSADRIVFDYASTTVDFAAQLVFDAAGLVLEYPGLGRRHG
jgi:uncharacterized protein